MIGRIISLLLILAFCPSYLSFLRMSVDAKAQVKSSSSCLQESRRGVRDPTDHSPIESSRSDDTLSSFRTWILAQKDRPYWDKDRKSRTERERAERERKDKDSEARLREVLGERYDHVVERHVGKDLDYLSRRLRNEHLKEASTYYDLRIANHAIDGTLRDTYSEAKIRQWMESDSNTPLEVSRRFESPVGVVLREGQSGPEKGHTSVIILRKDKLSKRGYKIITSYVEK